MKRRVVTPTVATPEPCHVKRSGRSPHRPDDPNVRMSPGPTRRHEGATAIRMTRQAARWRRHRRSTYSGDLSTPFETSPTTRVTETLERRRAPPPEQPDCGDGARQLRRCAADAPPFGSTTMCEPDADVIGQPQGPTTTLGLTDGSCPELTTADRRETRQRAAARECRNARNKTLTRCKSP